MRINDDEIFSFRWAVSEVRLRIGKLQYIIKSDILCMCLRFKKYIQMKKRSYKSNTTANPQPQPLEQNL